MIYPTTALLPLNNPQVGVNLKNGAVEKTRTSTMFPPQRPQRCASTNSATTALLIQYQIRLHGSRKN
jgi:hypothetical protein